MQPILDKIAKDIQLEFDRMIFAQLDHTILQEKWRCCPDTEQNPDGK